MHLEKLLQNLTPFDVPNLEIVRRNPNYLTDAEMNLLFQQLNRNVETAKSFDDKKAIYTALFHRAMFWFMYTTGLRNAELRALQLHNLDITNLC